MGCLGKRKPPVSEQRLAHKQHSFMLTNILFFCQQKNSGKIIVPSFKRTIYRPSRMEPNTCPPQHRPAEFIRHEKAGFVDRNRLVRSIEMPYREITPNPSTLLHPV